MRSRDCRMRRAVPLVTPQGAAPAGRALICLLTGAWGSSTWESVSRFCITPVVSFAPVASDDTLKLNLDGNA
jgi:hypothetical protein